MTRTRLSIFLAPAVLLLLAGCAGAPPAESPVEETPSAPAEPAPAAPPAASIILDARLLAGNGNYDRAAAMLEELLSRDEENLDARRLLASVYSAGGRRKNAAAEWRRIHLLDPADPEAAYEVGVQLSRAGEWRELRTRMIETERLGSAEPRHLSLIHI